MKLFKLAMFIFVGAFAVGCGPFGDDYEPAAFTVDGDQAVMNGVIDGTTPGRVEDLIADYPEVALIIMQDVPGSDNDEANIEAARLVRSHGYATHVPADGEIASGGVDFFLAGVERSYADGAKFGVHSWAAGSGETGADIPQDDPEHELYLDYYAEMGVAADFYWFTLDAAPAESIHWMTADELVLYEFATK